MLSILAETGLPPDFDETFRVLMHLLRKIEVWWIVEFEIPTNPDFDGREIDQESILPGPVAGMQLLSDVALGGPEESRFYIDAFIKARNVRSYGDSRD
jgi:hypothetical protein